MRNERQGLCSRELDCFQSQQKQVLCNDSQADENACARWWIDINPVEQPIDENPQMLSKMSYRIVISSSGLAVLLV